MTDRCDKCGSRIDEAVESGERLVSELLCQHCFTECSDVVCEVEDAERKRRKAFDAGRDGTTRNRVAPPPVIHEGTRH